MWNNRMKHFPSLYENILKDATRTSNQTHRKDDFRSTRSLHSRYTPSQKFTQKSFSYRNMLYNPLAYRKCGILFYYI